jgi:hypothetical protein
LLCQDDFQDNDLGVLFSTAAVSDVIPLDLALLSRFGIPVRKELIERFSLDYYVQNEICARYQNYGYINLGDRITGSFTFNKKQIEVGGKTVFDLSPFLSDDVLLKNIKNQYQGLSVPSHPAIRFSEQEWKNRCEPEFPISGIAKIIRSACVFFPMDIVFLGGRSAENPRIAHEVSTLLHEKPKVQHWEVHENKLLIDAFVQKLRERFVKPLLDSVTIW